MVLVLIAVAVGGVWVKNNVVFTRKPEPLPPQPVDVVDLLPGEYSELPDDS